MAVTEQARFNVYKQFAQALGEEVAATVMEMLHTVPADVATKTDLAYLREATRADLAQLRQWTELRFDAVEREFASVRREMEAMRSDFASVRADVASLRDDLADMRSHVDDTMRKYLLATLGLTCTIVGLVAGAARFL